MCAECILHFSISDMAMEFYELFDSSFVNDRRIRLFHMYISYMYSNDGANNHITLFYLEHLDWCGAKHLKKMMRTPSSHISIFEMSRKKKRNMQSKMVAERCPNAHAYMRICPLSSQPRPPNIKWKESISLYYIFRVFFGHIITY